MSQLSKSRQGFWTEHNIGMAIGAFTCLVVMFVAISMGEQIGPVGWFLAAAGFLDAIDGGRK